MNRANTLAIWCMFAQVFPLFQEVFKDGFHKFSWVVVPTQYPQGIETVEALGRLSEQGGDLSTIAANPTAMTVISALALITNIIALCYIVYVSKKRHINPYKQDVFVDQKYYKDALARADVD